MIVTRGWNVSTGAGERNISLDLLKLAMAAMVVGLHGGFLEEEAPTLSHFLTEGAFRVAVPTFFVVNGFYLERQIATKGVDWFARIAKIFVIWTMVYSIFWFDFENMSLRVRLRDVIPGYYHLWYLTSLLGGALTFLLLRRICQSNAAMLLAVVAMFAVGVIIQYAGNWHLAPNEWWDQKLNSTLAYRNFLFFGFPFLAIGALIARLEPGLDGIGGRLRFLMPLAFIALAAEWAINFHFNEPAEFDLYASLLVVAPLLFLVARRSNFTGTSKTLALVAICIYLLHPMIQMLLDLHMDVTGTSRTLVSLAVSAGLAPAIIAVNRRLPLL